MTTDPTTPSDQPNPAEPPVPKLAPEFRVRLTLPSGSIVVLQRDDLADACATVRDVTNGAVVIERRLCTEWAAIPAKKPRAKAREPRDC